MNIFAISTLCIVALTTAHGEVSEDTKTMAEQNKECVDKTKITLEELEALTVRPTADVPKSNMCYIKCVLELAGLEKDGVVQKDEAVAKRPEGLSMEDAEKAIVECSALAADDPCETSFKRYLCVFEKGEKRIWMKPE